MYQSSHVYSLLFFCNLVAAGLDFPDMGIESALDTQATVTSDPKVHLNGSRKFSTGSASDGPFAPAGRDRAMSFEFFSFGINADEPLPDVTQAANILTRPRGDSIIFDPVSFQDGGILEEKVRKRSRTDSLDLDGVINPGSTAMYMSGYVVCLVDDQFRTVLL